MDNPMLYLIPLIGLLALVFTVFRSSWIKRQDAGNGKMKKIAGFISEGAILVLAATAFK